jgi:hypothetical protein
VTNKSRQGRANRRKGIEFERKLIHLLRDRLPGWTIPDRGMQVRGGRGEPDVSATCGGLALHIECKTGAAPGLKAALAQAERDRNPHAIPVGVCHWLRGETLVCLSLDSFIELLAEIGNPQPTEDQ